MSAAPRVEAGAVTVLRLYDVAYAIDLDAVEALGAAQAPSVGRIRLTRAEPKAIDFGVPPVEIGLGAEEMATELGIERGAALARVYDFGVVSILLRIPLVEVPWEELVARTGAIDRAASGSPTWSNLLGRVRQLIAPAIDRPTSEALEEDYVLMVVHRFDRPMTAAELLAEVDLAPLLSGERQPLSESARHDLLRHAFSYYTTDLAVLTWDHAFLLEPSMDRDVADVLEVANAQLLELRYYDELLDAELPRMYDRVEAARGKGFAGLARRRYADLARSLYTLVAEVTETTERVDNALKVTEDVYLARIYGAALDLFRVPTWSAAVNHKLNIIRDTYTALYEEASTARAEWLEFGIFVLIVLELVLALL